MGRQRRERELATIPAGFGSWDESAQTSFLRLRDELAMARMERRVLKEKADTRAGWIILLLVVIAVSGTAMAVAVANGEGEEKWQEWYSSDCYQLQYQAWSGVFCTPNQDGQPAGTFDANRGFTP